MLSKSDETVRPSALQFGGHFRQSSDLIVCPAMFDGDILALDVAGFLQA
jgi:hypothetical protein